MKKFASILLTLAVSISAGAQDTKSKEILSELSNKAKGYKTIKATFKKTYKSSSDKKSFSNGKLYSKDKKFYLETGEGQNMYSDGRTVWTHIIDDDEVYKCPLEQTFEGEDITEPGKLLTIWENDFKTRYLKEETIDGKKYDVINLHPSKPGSKKFHTITVKVNKAKKEVDYIIIHGKDGSITTYRITSFKTNDEISDGQFRYRGGAEIIDCD